MKPVRPTTIYTSFQWGSDGQHALVIWKKEKPGWVEVRGTYDESEDDPLQRVLDSFPGWFVSGIFSSEIEPVSCYDHYIEPYRILEGLLETV